MKGASVADAMALSQRVVDRVWEDIKDGRLTEADLADPLDYQVAFAAAVAREEAAGATVKLLAEVLAKAAAPVWQIGDGYGGWVRELLDEAFVQEGLPLAPPRRGNGKRKARISHQLRRAVLERDAYRCQRCGAWQDLSIDHVVAESKGGPTELDNLQTLCRSCNSSKGTGP